jgi:hypothetical protein
LLPNSVTVLMLTLLYFASCVGIASAILSRFGTLAPPKHAHLYHRVQVQGTPAMYNPVSHAVAPPPPVESPVRQQGAPEQQPPVP